MPNFRFYILASISNSIEFTRHQLPYGERIWSIFDAFSLFIVDLARLFAGRWSAQGIENCSRPAKHLVLYEFEGCPYCRKVRETLSVLDLDHYVYPCPRETLKQSGVCLNSRYRPEVWKSGGRIALPYLIDPNTDLKLFESDDIISYLWKMYGTKAKAPLNYTVAHWPPFRDLSMKIVALCRPCVDMGILRAPSHKPEKPLELWGYESSPFVRRVREVLSRLESPYLYHEMAWGSDEKRAEFRKQHLEEFGQKALRDKFSKISQYQRYLIVDLVQVPFLKDPNSGMELFESSKIVAYLMKKYQTSEVPNESWLDYGKDDEKKHR